jgi:hypothetical protein
MYDLAIVIERFDALHVFNITTAIKVAKQVLVLVGSAYNSEKTYTERAEVIKQKFPNVSVEPLADHIYMENQWLTDVQEIVRSYASKNIVLVGHIKSFPQWSLIETERVKQEQRFDPDPDFTVSAVVLQSGHILLKEGKYLPNTQLKANRIQEMAIIDELREVLKLKVPVPVLRGSIVAERTLVGDTVTQAFLFQLKNDEPLPKVKDARWVPLVEFYDMVALSDFHIIRKMIDNV